MGRVLITDRLDPAAVGLLEAAGHEVHLEVGPHRAERLAQLASHHEALVVTLADEVDDAVLAAGADGALTVVATVSVGADHVDLEAARRLGVQVANTPDVLTAATAELAVALMLTVLRGTRDGEEDLRAGRWEGWSLNDHLGRGLRDVVVGLVGLGRIGREVERLVTAFGAAVLHHQRHDVGAPGYVADLGELCDRVDLLSLHVPLTPGTRGLIGARELQRLGRGGVLVNVARGGVVDEAALVAALEAGTIAGAGLDCFEGEPVPNPRLLAAPNLVLWPHLGSATRSTRAAMAELACSAVVAVLAGERPANLL